MLFAAFLARNPQGRNQNKTKQSRKNINNTSKHCLAINKHLHGFVIFFFFRFGETRQAFWGRRQNDKCKKKLAKYNVIRTADKASARLELYLVWLILSSSSRILIIDIHCIDFTFLNLFLVDTILFDFDRKL